MTRNILILGAANAARSELLLAKLRYEYGDDIVLFTVEEAQEQGLLPQDFANVPTMKITKFPVVPLIPFQKDDILSRSPHRNLRREWKYKERSNNKHKRR